MLVRVRLAEEELWKRFSEEQNEMIITKTGRCLFPLLRIHFEPFQGLSQHSPIAWPCLSIQPQNRYSVAVTMVQCDSMRWRYRGNRWIPVLSASESRSSRSSSYQEMSSSSPSSSQFSSQRIPVFSQCPSPSRPQLHLFDPLGGHRIKGEELLARGLSMAHVKVTNRPESLNSNDPSNPSFCLTSFHRYQPLIYLLDHDQMQDERSIDQVLMVQAVLPPYLVSFTLPMTQFIAVTHYQNQVITDLKKSFNPHAKGFAVSHRYADEEDEEGTSQEYSPRYGASPTNSSTDDEYDEEMIEASRVLASLKKPIL